MTEAFGFVDSKSVGDPAKASKVIYSAVTSENPPFRLPVGPDAYEAIDQKLRQVETEVSAWRDRSTDTNFDAAAIGG
jgi:hypothetical protein